MARGPRVFGTINLAAATSADVFQSPANGGVFNVTFTNNTGSAATIKLSLSQTTATQNANGN